jgi:hypothetical protein
MRQLALAGLHPLFDLPQAMRTAQLAKQHRHKLLPAAHAARVSLGAELANLPFEVAARNELENLAEQTAKWTHGELSL